MATLLAGHGAVVVDADRIAREVVEPGSPGLTAVVAAFGEEVLTSDGRLDRGRLGASVFADAQRRRLLEAITHPLIRARTAELVAEALGRHPPLVAVDVPLLFEVDGAEDYPDGVLLVYADAQTQMRRLEARDHLDRAAAEQRLAAQLPIDTKLARATWVIDNRGTPAETAAAVERWWRDAAG